MLGRGGKIMKLHSQAALTLKQRQRVKRLHEEGVSIRDLAQRLGVNPTTIQRWTKRESPLDKNSAPLTPQTVITPEYRVAVIDYRMEHQSHGPIRIAQELKERFPWANRGTVLRILQREGLTRPPKREKAPRTAIPVGRHRIQMDIQQLPAVQGGTGFEYKISAIHLRTRLKYTEIHADRKSATVAGVLKRALDLLPPFFSSGPTTPTSSP
ncbi:MAG: helix-turn-helix domain-containing protein [Deltaproteobacteria bacterium]|nr:helix-turn-helix domain-containing protein [Deltaproteobacteria bacterium]